MSTSQNSDSIAKSDMRPTIRRLVQKVAEEIDPNVEVSIVKIGEDVRGGDRT